METTNKTKTYKNVPLKYLLNRQQHNFIQKQSVLKVPVANKTTGEIFHKHFIIESNLEKWSKENQNPAKAISFNQDSTFDLTLLEKQGAIEIDNKNKTTLFSPKGEELKQAITNFLTIAKSNPMFKNYEYTNIIEKDYEKDGVASKTVFINNLPRESNLATIAFTDKNGKEQLFNVVRLYKTLNANKTEKLFFLVHAANLKHATFIDKNTQEKKTSSNFNLHLGENTNITLLETKSFSLNTLVSKAEDEKLFDANFSEQDIIETLKRDVATASQGIPANIKIEEPVNEPSIYSAIETEYENIEEQILTEEEKIEPIGKSTVKKFTL